MITTNNNNNWNPLPWLSLVAVIWLQAVIGTNTNFAAYSSQLKQYLSLSQLQLNALAFASDAGKLFGWVSGLAASHMPLWVVLSIGSSLGFVSYGLQFLSLNDTASSPSKTTSFLRSYPTMFFLNTVAGNSICWVNTVCYIVVTRNFPLDQQVAVGITTSYQGLTTKIYAVVVDELFSSRSPPDKSYLLLDSLFPLLVSALALLLMAKDLAAEGKGNAAGGSSSVNEVVRCRRRMGFLGLFVITTVTGGYAVLSSVSAKLWHLFRYSGMVFTFGLLAAPLAIPAAGYVRCRYVAYRERLYEVDLEEEKRKGDVAGDKVKMVRKGGGGVGEETTSSSVDDGEGGPLLMVKEEVGVKVMLQRAEFWLYVFVYFLGPTIGIVYLNNLGQIAESRRCYQTASLVSLSSSFTFFGRLLPSLLDYFFSRNKYLPPRPALLLILMAPITAALFLLLNESHAALYVSTAMIGICTGAITSIAVSITSELFGSQNFAVNHNVVVANIPVGSFCFGYLAAKVYESETVAGESKCMGTNCYRRTFIVWGQLSCFGVLLAFLLYNRTRLFYSQRLKRLNSFLNH